MFIREETGSRFTDSFEILNLEGHRAAVIVSVKSVGGSNSLAHLGTRIAGPGRTVDAIQKIDSFPPQTEELGSLRPAAGYRISPVARTRRELGYELLLGYKVEQQELAIRKGILVRYAVGSVTYETFLPARMVFCPEKMTERECSKLAYARFPSG